MQEFIIVPESEFAFLYTKDRMRIRLQTARDDVKTVWADQRRFYTFAEEKWYQKQQPMNKAYTTDNHDYWEIEVTASHHRLAYFFVLQIFQVSRFFIQIKGFLTMKKNV